MDKLKISFHPIFILFAFALVYFGKANMFLTYIAVLILHESAHYIVAKCLGYKLNKIMFMPYGVSLNGNNIMTKKDEILIALAGPICNLILVILFVTIWWFKPISYYYTYNFVLSNLVLGVFNLLPFFPMDGGRLVYSLIRSSANKYKLLKALKIVSIFIGIICSVLFVITLKYSVNYSLLFISIFLYTSSIDNSKTLYYERSINLIKKNSQSALPTKTFVIGPTFKASNLIKYINGNYYSIFFVMQNGKIIKTINEDEVLSVLMKTKL